MIILYDMTRNLARIYKMADPAKTTANSAPTDQDEAVIEAPEVDPVAAATAAELAVPAFPPVREVEDEDDEVAVEDDSEAVTEAVIEDDVDWV